MSKALNIQCFLHADFEGPGVIARWAEDKGHRMEFTRLYQGNPLPETGSVDFLVIMGGPMDVFDFHIHPWMQEEIDWVRDFIDYGKPVLGICLGAQILAASLGSEIFPGKHKEIGWYNLKFLPCMGDYKICKDLPSTRKVFHWHGDTFHIPRGAFRIAETQVTANQGFIYEGRVLALQFHLEVTPDDVAGMVKHCGDELVPGPFIQKASEILEENRYFEDNQQLMFNFLDYLSGLTD